MNRRFAFLVLCLLAVLYLFPFYWALQSSLKSPTGMKMTPPTLTPQAYVTRDAQISGHWRRFDGDRWLVLDPQPSSVPEEFALALRLGADNRPTDHFTLLDRSQAHVEMPEMSRAFVATLPDRHVDGYASINQPMLTLGTMLRQVDGQTRAQYLVRPLDGGTPRLISDVHPEHVTEFAPRWQNYAETLAGPEATMGAAADHGFLRYLFNSLVISGLAVLGQCLSSSFVAFAFARLRFPGRDVLFVMLLATLMVPFQVTLIPLFGIYKSLGWIDTFLPLVVPHFTAGAFNVFLLRQYMLGLPKELDESVAIDGGGALRTWWSVILPNCWPALIVVALFTFVATWQDVLGPLIYLDDPALRTVTLGLEYFRSPYVDNSHLLMTGAVLAMIPVAIVFLILQRWIMAGIATTGIKG